MTEITIWLGQINKVIDRTAQSVLSSQCSLCEISIKTQSFKQAMKIDPRFDQIKLGRCPGWTVFAEYTDHFVMPPTSKKLREHIGFGMSVRACMLACVRLCVCSSKMVHARVLKVLIWIPHGNIVGTCFFFLSELSPFLELCPFEKIKTKSDACHILWTVHSRVLKFHIWIPHGKLADPYFIFLVRVISLSELCPFEKNQNELLAARYLEKYWSSGLDRGW